MSSKGLGRRVRVVVVEASTRDDEGAEGSAGRWVVAVVVDGCGIRAMLAKLIRPVVGSA